MTHDEKFMLQLFGVYALVILIVLFVVTEPKDWISLWNNLCSWAFRHFTAWGIL